MARVGTVKKARKDQGTCQRCRKQIKAGDGYYWAAPGGIGARTLFWCTEHYPRRGELTSSKLGPVYDAQDEAQADIESGEVSEFESRLSELADTAQEAVDEYDNFASEYPALYEGSTSEQNRDALEEFVSTLQSWTAESAPECSEHGEEECEACSGDEDAEHYDSDYCAELEQWVEDQRNSAIEAIQSLQA